MTEVKQIIPSENKIITEDHVFHYDKLVIATVCKTNFKFLEIKKNGKSSFWDENTQKRFL